MPRPPSPSIAEKEFVYGALKQSLRVDGRTMLEMRNPTLTFGPELGWVECALGKTRCVLPLPSANRDVSLTCDIAYWAAQKGARASRREDGEASARAAARGHDHDTLGALAHGVHRVRAWPVGTYLSLIFRGRAQRAWTGRRTRR